MIVTKKAGKMQIEENALITTKLKKIKIFKEKQHSNPINFHAGVL